MSDFLNILHSEHTSTVFKIMFLSIIFLYGIAIGSFLNVVIYRLPAGQSILGIGRSDAEKEEASHCMKCGAKIRPIDLIPVFSWLMLRGKCHNCVRERYRGFPYFLQFKSEFGNKEFMV